MSVYSYLAKNPLRGLERRSIDAPESEGAGEIETVKEKLRARHCPFSARRSRRRVEKKPCKQRPPSSWRGTLLLDTQDRPPPRGMREDDAGIEGTGTVFGHATIHSLKRHGSNVSGLRSGLRIVHLARRRLPGLLGRVKRVRFGRRGEGEEDAGSISAPALGSVTAARLFCLQMS